MRAGWLRHRVKIQTKTETRNDYGEPVYSWSDLGTAWASIEPLSARETLEARTTLQETTTRIRMRQWTTVTSEMRAVWGSHVYDITEVIRPFEKGEEMILICTEVI